MQLRTKYQYDTVRVGSAVDPNAKHISSSAAAKDHATKWLQSAFVSLDLDNKAGKDPYGRGAGRFRLASASRESQRLRPQCSRSQHRATGLSWIPRSPTSVLLHPVVVRILSGRLLLILSVTLSVTTIRFNRTGRGTTGVAAAAIYIASILCGTGEPSAMSLTWPE